VELRRPLALTTTLVVAVVVITAAIICYAVMRGELRGQVDDQLTGQGDLVESPRGRGFGPFGGNVPAPPPRAGGTAPYVQVVAPGGATRLLRGDAKLPVTDGDRAAAEGRKSAALSDRDAGGQHLRVLSAPLPGGGAVLLGRSLEGVDRTLAQLRLVLLGLCAAAVVAAALLSRRIADRFAAVLARLEDAQTAQRQLVADASHELRTPVTALRMNAELLLEEAGLDPAQREALLRDVVDQTEELGALVTDLIELARGDQPAEEVHDVRLDALVAEAVERARRHAPHVSFATALDPVALDGVPERLGRAVNNLLDNAAKYAPDGSEIDVTVAGTTLTVRDRGPGVPPEELPHIFDRFYRASNARERTGSGLGLAIVKQVAERHGGTVRAEAAPGGGLAVILDLPSARPVTAVPAPAGR
jgi:two-component system, OmpR family, sensor histidine kinase MprB